MQEAQLWFLGGEDPLEKWMPPTPVCLPGEFHGQMNLVGYSPWGHKEPEITEWLTHWTEKRYQWHKIGQMQVKSVFQSIVLHYWLFLSIHNHTRAQALQSCPTLCDPMDHGQPGSSVHGILQARILEWVAMSFFSDKVWSEWSEVAQSCPTLCDPMDCSLPCSSFHRIFQARILECVAIAFSAGCFNSV